MKRIIAITMTLLMIAALLAACDKNVDLSGLLNDINSKYSLSDGIKKLETEDELDRYYNISKDDIKQFAGERASSSTDYTEIVIVEAKDSGSVSKIETQLNSRLDSQRSTAKSYTPEAVELLNSCSVKTNGNYVYLVINENADGINKMIEDALK